MTLNVQGLRSVTKRRSLFQHFHNHYKDSIIFLQETHSTAEIESTWNNEWGSEIQFCHYNNNSRGVGILLPKELDCTIDKIIRDEEGRFLIITIKIEKHEVKTLNVELDEDVFGLDQVDFSLEGRYQYYFSDVVEGLNAADDPANSSNDSMVFINAGVIYVFGKN